MDPMPPPAQLPGAENGTTVSECRLGVGSPLRTLHNLAWAQQDWMRAQRFYAELVAKLSLEEKLSISAFVVQSVAASA